MKLLIYMSGGFDHHGPSNHLYKALIQDALNKDIVVHLIQSKTTKNEIVPSEFKEHVNFSHNSVKKSNPKKRKFIQRYLSLVFYSYRCIKFIKMHRDADLVFVQSCVTAPFQIGHVKRYTKGKVIYNVQDMFPGSTIATGALRNKTLIKFFSLFQRKAYKKADVITVISEDMMIKLAEEKVSNNKIYIIPNWYDHESVYEIDFKKNKFVEKYNINENEFIVQYAGGMGYVFDYEIIIDLAKRLKKNKDILFYMIGNGSRLEDFKNEVIKNKLDNIRFLPMQPQKEVAHVYSAASICLIPLRKGVIGNSVPSKAASIMACGRITINVVDRSGYYDMINKNNIGYAFTHEEIENIAPMILYLKDNKNIREHVELQAKKYAQSNLSRKILTSKYIDLFYKVGDSND